MNRFTWDMRYPDATGFPKIILWAGNLRGPVAVPGKYQVRLTAAGQTLTQSFSITRNPNLAAVTDADLQEQFKLAMQIRDKLSQANETVVKIRQTKDQITERVAKLAGVEPAKVAQAGGIGAVSKELKGGNAKIADAGVRLIEKLTDIEGEIYQYRNQSNQDPLNFPIKINNRIASLLRVVNAGDGKPLASVYPIFKDLTAELRVQTDRLKGVLATDVPATNAELRRLGLQPLDPAARAAQGTR